MDTEKCAALLRAVQEGSLSAAAEALGYTASGISRAVASLERETGFPLLNRGRSGVEPTAECRRLLPVMEELVRAGERYARISEELLGLETGDVTVGTAYPACYRWLSQVIAGFGGEHPGIEVNVRDGSSSQLVAELANHRLDFCIVSFREGDFQWLPLRRDPIVAWVPEKSPLAALPAFPVEKLGELPYIESYRGGETDNSRMLARLGVRPNTRFTVRDSAANHAMVAAGLGVSLNNSVIERGEGGGVAVLPLSPPELVEIGIAAPLPEVISPAARRFLEFAKKRLPELELAGPRA